MIHAAQLQSFGVRQTVLPTGRMNRLGGFRFGQTAGFFLAIAFLAPAAVVRADDDFERPPINYSKTTPNTRIERLQEKIDAGKVELSFHPERGYL